MCFAGVKCLVLANNTGRIDFIVWWFSSFKSGPFTATTTKRSCQMFTWVNAGEIERAMVPYKASIDVIGRPSTLRSGHKGFGII